MFNILLMVAGILEYVLLGIDFKVSERIISPRPTLIPEIGQLSKYLLGWNLDTSRLFERRNRLLPDPEV